MWEPGRRENGTCCLVSAASSLTFFIFLTDHFTCQHHPSDQTGYGEPSAHQAMHVEPFLKRDERRGPAFDQCIEELFWPLLEYITESTNNVGKNSCPICISLVDVSYQSAVSYCRIYTP